jgi:hypothetical protein
MSVHQANAEAFRIDAEDVGYSLLGIREMAARVGCATSTFGDTDYWLKKICVEQPGRLRRKRNARTVRLTDGTMARTAQFTDAGDISDQAAKREQATIELIKRSSMVENEKQALVQKLEIGEITPQGAAEVVGMARRVPKKQRQAAS